MNVLDLAGKYVEVKKVASTKGGEYVGPCPGCGGTDRFHVWPEQKHGEGSWWCRGCGKGGDGIQFLMDFDGKSFVEACEALDKPLPDRDSFYERGPAWQDNQRPPAWTPGKVSAPEGVDAGLWREKAGAFADWAHGRLMENGEQLQYLASRGIKKETVERFKLGYNPGEGKYRAFFRPRASWGLPKEARENGKEKKLWIPRGIVVPYIRGKEVLRLRIRRDPEDLTDNFPQKYYVVPGSTMTPMLMGEDRRAFVVIETELDGMLVFQEAGDLVGVLAVGSASAKPDAAAYEIMKKSVCILVALDRDPAGYGAWKWWKDRFRQVEWWPVPVGKDPGEAHEKGRNLRVWVAAGLPHAFGGMGNHTGPFILDGGNKGVADLKETTADQNGNGVPEDAPEGLKELYGLMCRLRVAVEKRPGGMRLKEKMGYEHWEESKRVSHLVFMDPDVYEYLSGHPAKVVHRGNFWEGY